MKPPDPPHGSNQTMEDSAAHEEADYVSRAKARDQEAFRWLVERHRHTAYGVALRIVRSPEDAEDVSQEAFVRAWRALPRFQERSKFSTWLHRIVARRAIDRYGELKRMRMREVPDEAPDRPDPAASTPGEGLMRSMRIEALIRTLPLMQRATLTLFYYEEHSVREVAEALGIPDGTVKTHLSRGRTALRAALLRETEKSG